MLLFDDKDINNNKEFDENDIEDFDDYTDKYGIIRKDEEDGDLQELDFNTII